MYLNSILLHFLQWRWESNFALREIVPPLGKGGAHWHFYFSCYAFWEQGLQSLRRLKQEAADFQAAGRSSALQADPGDLFKAKGGFPSHPKLVGRMLAQRWCCAPEVRGSRGSPGCCTACGQIFCWAGAVHRALREVPQGFSLGLSLLSARSLTVQAVDRDFQTELSFCSF